MGTTLTALLFAGQRLGLVHIGDSRCYLLREGQFAQITHGDEGWVLEDLGTEHGTFLGDKQIKRRIIHNGDEYRLAGYLRMRTELR